MFAPVFSTVLPYLLSGFLEYYASCNARLANYASYDDWTWIRREDGLNAQRMSDRKGVFGFRNKPVHLTVFGVVSAVNEDGTLDLVRPQWDRFGAAGQNLGTQFQLQLVALCRVLDEHDMSSDLVRFSETPGVQTIWEVLSPLEIAMYTLPETSFAGARWRAKKTGPDRIDIGDDVVVTRSFFRVETISGRPDQGKLPLSEIPGNCRVKEKKTAAAIVPRSKGIAMLTLRAVRPTYSSSLPMSLTLSAVHAFASQFSVDGYNKDTEYWLRKVTNQALLAWALNDTVWLDIVRVFAEYAVNRAGPVSDTGSFVVLPLELAFEIIALLDSRARINFAVTCKELKFLCAAFVDHELCASTTHFYLRFSDIHFMLVTTRTFMTGHGVEGVAGGSRIGDSSLDFWAEYSTTRTVLVFLQAVGPYTLDPVPVPGDLCDIWILRSRGRVIRVRECHSGALYTLLSGPNTHGMGYCDRNAIRHAYPELMDMRVALSTPFSMPIDYTREAVVTTWRMVRRVVDHGFTWAAEYDVAHVCGKSFNCPATSRRSRDGGWMSLALPLARYGRSGCISDVGWTLRGVGCYGGVEHGPEPSMATLANYAVTHAYWFDTMAALAGSSTAPTGILAYYV
ncbi:hypothetical protein DFH06DRAFT_1135701 [Mycena polygramma]|nr:hypothetical protein DFH06DRAFT_1135701 [Mycena polygramma]